MEGKHSGHHQPGHLPKEQNVHVPRNLPRFRSFNPNQFSCEKQSYKPEKKQFLAVKKLLKQIYTCLGQLIKSTA